MYIERMCVPCSEERARFLPPVPVPSVFGPTILYVRQQGDINKRQYGGVEQTA